MIGKTWRWTRRIGLIAMLALAEASLAESMWIEPNFVDTEYSVLLESVEVAKYPDDAAIHDDLPFGFVPYRVTSTVGEVYKGPLAEGDEITVLLYLSPPFDWALEQIDGTFVLSFCRSSGGVFYTHRDYSIVSATAENMSKFRAVSQNGTDYEGAGDCSSTNYPDLNPDTHTDASS